MCVYTKETYIALLSTIAEANKISIGPKQSNYRPSPNIMCHKSFACLKEAPKKTLWSLLTSDMLYIASNSILKTSCTTSGTLVTDKRK